MTPALALASSLFERLASGTADPPGVTRASYGPGEAFAHELVGEAAREMDLDVSRDPAGNQYMTWPGRNRARARIFIGSHMDSVRHGGNFDGAAGVIMGLAAVRALKDRGFEPAQDIVVMAIRAEELVWFPTPYAGSRMAFGLLDPGDYDTLRRSDTGRTLAQHLREAGFDPEALKAGAKPLDPSTIRFYIEPHIEQGPVLERRGLPVGIVSGIRGNLRYRHCRIVGEWGHAGAQPREYRRDAVLAGVEFVHTLERVWDRYDAAGADFVATVGEFSTDPEMHGMTKIPGAVRFTMDIRSLDNDLLLQTDRELREAARRISARRGVTIELADFTNAPPASTAPFLRRAFEDAAQAQGIPAAVIASGAGHDCATFAWQGIDTGMLFVRNRHGSHNPEEAMDMADFEIALRLLAGVLGRIG